jgi:hypothetical protein
MIADVLKRATNELREGQTEEKGSVRKLASGKGNVTHSGSVGISFSSFCEQLSQVSLSHSQMGIVKSRGRISLRILADCGLRLYHFCM